MMNKYFPYEYCKSVFDIDYEKLYQLGYKAIIFDIDNTLVHHGENATPQIEQLFIKLHDMGFKTILITDNDLERTLRFVKNINTPYICDAEKPSTASYLKALEILKVNKNEVVVIGDQIFKDILGANNSSLASIMVKFITIQNEKWLGWRRYMEYIFLFLWRFSRFKNRLGGISLTKKYSFLQMRGEKFERMGREHKLIYHDGSGKHDSITIRGSTWFDHKNQVGGGAIKFMREFYGMDFQQAMKELLGGNCSPTLRSPIVYENSVPEPKKEFKLPNANKNMHRVYAYLIKQRYISPEIITHFAKERLLYEDEKHHNAVFVGVDENGVARQAHKRSTNSFGKAFRLTCEGSDTKYSFAHFGKSAKLFVFEAAIDMLSYLTLNPQNWQEHSYIAMNGVYENAVFPYISKELFSLKQLLLNYNFIELFNVLILKILKLNIFIIITNCKSI